MGCVTAAKRRITGVACLLVLGWTNQAYAQLGVGNWVRTDGEGHGLTMTVEACCNGGLRLVYHIPPMAAGQPPMTMTVDSPMDGTDVPMLVGGKPTGQTMGIKRVDPHHYSAVTKMRGQPLGTSTGTLSPDGTMLTVESITSSPQGKAEKVIETWVRK